MHENRITGEVVDAAFNIHSTLGPGLLESVYEKTMTHELSRRGFVVLCQQPIAVVYESIRMKEGFRADLIINGKVIVELKSIEEIAPVHEKQLLTYLRLTGLRVGLLINFNVALIKNGITRIANGIE